MADSKEIVRVFRSYNKEKGWPMAHEAADLIESLEKENEALNGIVVALFADLQRHVPEFFNELMTQFEAAQQALDLIDKVSNNPA